MKKLSSRIIVLVVLFFAVGVLMYKEHLRREEKANPGHKEKISVDVPKPAEKAGQGDIHFENAFGQNVTFIVPEIGEKEYSMSFDSWVPVIGVYSNAPFEFQGNQPVKVTCIWDDPCYAVVQDIAAEQRDFQSGRSFILKSTQREQKFRFHSYVKPNF